MPKAYPVYDARYKDAIRTIRRGLRPLKNLQTIGRNGQHRYNNQDHSMLTGFLAAENATMGSRHDVWNVNVDSAYHEEVRSVEKRDSDRLVPARLFDDALGRKLSRGFARYDPVALGAACAAVLGVWIPFVTAIALSSGDADVIPMLSLLGSYFLGYRVSWAGALLGTVEGLMFGAIFGWTLGVALNRLIASERRRLERRLHQHVANELIDGS
jgi:hypothetical protein